MQPADVHLARDARAPRSSTDCTTAASSSGGSVFGMHDHRGAPAERGGARAGLDRLGLLAARLAEVHLDVDEAGRDDAALGVEHERAGRRRRAPAPTSAITPSTTRTSATRSPVCVDDAPAPDRAHATLRQRALPIRAATTARPCAPRRRSRPARSRATRGVGDLGRDLDAAVHRARGASRACRACSRAARSAREPPARACTRAASGTAPAPMPLALDPQQVDDVDVGRARRRGRSVTVTGQPSSRSGMQRRRADERDVAAERGAARARCCARRASCAMSPTIATRQPSSDGPRWRRSVNASSSAWVGCSWRPSPALTTLAVDPRRDPVRRAGRAVAHDDRVDAHRLDRLHGVEQALALLHRRRRRPRTSSCRRERRFAAVSNESRVRVESS